MIPTASLPFSTPAPKLGRLLVVDDEAEVMTALCQMLTHPSRRGARRTVFANPPEHSLTETRGAI